MSQDYCERCGRPEKPGTRIFPRIGRHQIMVHLDCNGGHSGIECGTGREVECLYSPSSGESVWEFVPDA